MKVEEIIDMLQQIHIEYGNIDCFVVSPSTGYTHHIKLDVDVEDGDFRVFIKDDD